MHPADDRWQAWVDGQVPEDGPAELRQHLDLCAECRARVDALTVAGAQVASLLALLEAPPTGRSADSVMRPRLRSSWTPLRLAAASVTAILVVTGVASAAGGLRAVRRLVGWAPQEHSVPAVRAEFRDSAAAMPAQTGIAFEARGTLEVVFVANQRAGTITMSFTDDSTAAVSGTQVVAYGVRRGRVTITNGGSGASYDVRIPRRLVEVRLVVRGRTILEKNSAGISTTAVPDSLGRFVQAFNVLK